MKTISIVVLSLLAVICTAKRQNANRYSPREPWRSMLESFEQLAEESSEETKDSNAELFDPSVVVVDSGHSFGHKFQPFTPFWSVPRPNPWRNWMFGFKQQEPWWKGTNVCVERKVIDGSNDLKRDANTTSSHRSSFTFSSQTTHCVENEESYVCTTRLQNDKVNKTTVVKHECCHGFKRKGSSGCVQVHLTNLTETLKEIGATKLMESLSMSKVEEQIGNQNVTIFSPTNDAWIDFTGFYNKKENEIPIIADKEPAMKENDFALTLRHLFRGILKSDDLTDNQLLTSMDNVTQVRVNVYQIPKRVVTLNCAPIITANTRAVNGVVHVIDRVMPVADKTVGELIEKNPQFSIFKTLLQKQGLLSKLKNASNHYTVFVPTNDAMKKLDSQLLKHLEEGHSCFSSIAGSHVVERILCSSGIFNTFKVNSLASYPLTLKRTVDQKLLVDNVEINTKDIVGSNGVIQPTNDLIIPENVKPLSTVLQHSITNDFFELLNKSGQLSRWDLKENASFFIPTNEALKKFMAQKSELANETEELVSLHFVKQKMKTDNFYNNELLESSNGKSMRVNQYGDFPEPFSRTTVQCANIVYQNRDVCGGVIHVVDKVLIPSQENLIKALESSPNFSTFAKLVKISGLENKLKSESGPYTLLVPKDDAFERQMTKEQLNEHLTNPKKAVKLVQKHIIPEFLCCSGVSQMPLLFSLQQFRTMDGSSISAYRDFEGKIKFGPSTTKQCDLIAENGVIHEIDRLLQPRKQPTTGVVPFFQIFIN